LQQPGRLVGPSLVDWSELGGQFSSPAAVTMIAQNLETMAMRRRNLGF
jgi:hypothetical protein